MLTHDEALHLLSARVDGELTPEQERDLEAWLSVHPDDQVLVEAFQTQRQEMQQVFEPRRAAAARTAERVAQLICEPAMPARPRLRPRWRLFGYVLPPFAAAAIAFWCVSLLQQPETPRPDQNQMAVQPAPLNPPAPGDVLTPRAKPPAPVVAMAAIGQNLTTAAGEKRRAVLPDGSAVYLDQNTSVQLLSERKVRLERGRIFVEAVPADKDAGRDSFVVWAPKHKLEALGTKFTVDAAGQGLSVVVTQGSVKVDGADRPVAAGQALQTEGGMTRITPAHRASYDLDWTRDLMVAADSPLVPAGKYDGGALVAVDPYGQEAKLSLVKYHIDVHIEDGFARTTIDQTYFNHENFQMEGTFYFPLPPDASLSRLAMYVANGEMCSLMEGGMAERDFARQTYERIRDQRRDPALLEWVDGSLFKMRVFPLEARQEKRLVLSYTQRLPVQYNRTTYRFPAGHTLNVVKEWSFAARVKNGAALTATSPSHPAMKTERPGNDLVLHDRAEQAKIDRDVVLELTDAQAATGDSVRWSSAEHEGAKYLMLRYRTELQGSPRRERRDWVFLFEASGGRDPLVARAQVEIIRALLNNAEHDDTFALLTVGTRVHKFSDVPQRVTESNVARALAFLDKAHLIGALNLEQGFTEATPYLAAGANPHLVHLGGGIATLGEHRIEHLVPRLPPGTRYVGVAVGKRFAPAFMKVAAEKTDGFFTQINPDEPIAWRGFELASALNTPRLLNITLEARCEPAAQATVALACAAGSSSTLACAAGSPACFLPFANSLAQGEELAAVARIDGAAPTAIIVRGTENGVPFERTLPVKDVAAQADYLPRTWAKLEIDRLLAEDAGKHRQTITELSKAMYVMTPFTSLLVLENEAMYKEFKVDRGRKDHWAMYPCPEKIPTVYVPDPNQPTDRNAPRFKDRKPHANVVRQTIVRRPPQQYFTDQAHRHEGYAHAQVTFNNEGLEVIPSFGAVPGFDAPSRVGDLMLMTNTTMRDNVIRRQINFGLGTALSTSDLVDAERSLARLELVGDRTMVIKYGLSEAFADLPIDATDRMGLLLNESEDLRQVQHEKNRFWHTNQPSSFTYERLSGSIDPGDPYSSSNALSGLAGAKLNGWTTGLRVDVPLALRDGVQATEEQTLPYVTGGQFTRLGESRRFNTGKPMSLRFINPDSNGSSEGPRYYARPSFNGQERVFTDLAAYAPGMSASAADIRAVLEAEAAPRVGDRRGTIDQAARVRIESARQAKWRAIACKDATGVEFLFHHDGQGRYAYEHRLDLGLIERVVCDGSTILHLYPELGIGARRHLSRFHRAELCAMLGDVLPPAEDLNHGFDVKLIDENTVALVPLSATPQAESVETHLLFEGNRLAERRWLLMPAKKLLGRVVYATDGLVALLDAKGKEAGKDRRTLKETAEPDLHPDVGSLVVLELPLRSREFVLRKYGLNPDMDLLDNRGQVIQGLADWLPPEAPMELLGCEFAANQGHLVKAIWKHFFAAHGDIRPGFFTLMLSAGQFPHEVNLFREQCAKLAENNTLTPLMRYLALTFEPNTVWCQQQLGLLPGPEPANDFLSNLLVFRSLALRWQGNAVNDRWLGQRTAERERALAFVRQHAGDVWGWCALGMVADRAHGQDVHEQLAAVWAMLAEKSGLRYFARYEQAVNLLEAGKSVDTRRRSVVGEAGSFAKPAGEAGSFAYDQARRLFRELFQETFKKGLLPPIDSRFRQAFLENSDGAEWRSLMHQAAKASIDSKHRPVVVLLAWQCRQLGDQALADELLEVASRDPANEKERIATSLTAIEYLWAIHHDDQADALVTQLLETKELQSSADLWRLASQVAERRGKRLRQFECLEKALDLEYQHMPDVFNIGPIRRDYRALLSHYEWLADAARNLQTAPPADLLARTVRAADRWRSLDSEATTACDLAARILRLLGGPEAEALAWDFITTPLALRPNESGPWLALAESATREGNLALADQCYEAAFAAEPTNAQILWDRAQLLERHGETARGRELLKQIAAGDWLPRFAGLKAQAKQTLHQ